MRFSTIQALLAFGAVASAHVLRSTDDLNCGEDDPTDKQRAASAKLSQANPDLLEKRGGKWPKVTVDVYTHVVTSKRSDALSPELIDNQIAFLNQAYNPFEIYFEHVDHDYIINKEWAVGGDDMAMKEHLRQGGYRDLNIYFLDKPISRSSGEAVNGYCPFPEEAEDVTDEVLLADGCIIRRGTVPGAGEGLRGSTTVHEVGHWFFLWHTFTDGCEGDGDFVSDTPAQARRSKGCPTFEDSCPNHPGVDPIHNFMNYSSDECRESFTVGQGVRMHNAWTAYRKNAD
jgi:hypothetical protein